MLTSRNEQLKAVQMIQVPVRHGFIGAAKAVMKMLGVDVGPARKKSKALPYFEFFASSRLCVKFLISTHKSKMPNFKTCASG